MVNKSICPVSGYNAKITEKDTGTPAYDVMCELTGDYEILRSAMSTLQALEDEEKLRLVWILRKNHENGIKMFSHPTTSTSC